MGSSSASAVCLKGLLRYPELQVVGLVTQPDRPAGRGRELTPCPCRQYAIARGIKECITPENVNAPEALAWIRAKKPDAIAVVAFGQFLKKEILELPPFGCINCHFSLLPKYRGAAPVTAAVLAGDELSGVSVIKMGLGMDDGPILMSKVEPVYPEDTAETLMEKLAICGGVTLAKTMRMLAAGTLPPPQPQEEARVTFAHKIKKSDGLIDWSRLRSYDIERMLERELPDLTDQMRHILLEDVRKVGMKMVDDRLALMPGVPELLDDLDDQGYRVAVATTTSRELTEHRLKKMGVYDRFEYILCGNEVVKRKPDPEIYLKVLNALELRQEEVLVLEDTGYGVAAASAAGCDVIMVPSVNEPTEAEEARAYSIEKDLFAALERVRSDFICINGER